MILVIAPLVQRGAVDYRGVLRACFYMASLVATAVTFFLIVSALGRAAIGTALAPILPVLALALALREIGVVRLALPDSAFRVPRRWLRLGYWRGPITYGLAMGPGLFTSTPFASYHMLLLWLLLDSTPASAVVAGAAFGLTRGSSLFVGALNSWVGRANVDPTGWILARAGAVHVINALGLAAIAALAAAV